MAEEGRPKRRCARSKSSALPSAVHYVGYVEDDETPESIMRKFEEMETVRAAGSSRAPLGAGTVAMTDAQLVEVFKQTSMFNVKSVLANNEVLLGGGDCAEDANERALSDYETDDEDNWDALRGFWSDEDDQDHAEHWKRSRRLRKGLKLPRHRGAAGQAKPSRHNVVTHYNAFTQALIRRKVRAVDKDAINQVRVPNPPLPLSWGHSVQQFVPLDTCSYGSAADSTDENQSLNVEQQQSLYLERSDVCAADLTGLRREFQGILINPGWEANGADAAVVARLAALPIPKLCPAGFIFIYAEKEHIMPLMQQMYRWGYNYVENLTWVYMAANNTVLTLASSYAGRSHLTLFIFRREGEGKDIELRHQRNPDVTFDCIRASTGQPKGVPEETFVAIETLLPTGQGRFLELWAPKGAQRTGWAHVVQIKSAAGC
ncbi:hypothetical protein WJX72_006023 [[Myrmecia] bisecta]|uniref:Uncharacterized protein n=1 Tax=[Myrmecia] bisecta TaxID=41462 RepID=A0AAW1P3J0_9CHLO